MSRLDLNDLKTQPLTALLQTARDLRVLNAAALPSQQLICEILRAQGRSGGQVSGAGVLEILPDGFGFLRDPDANYLPGPDDIYVSPSQIRRFDLQNGDGVSGLIRAPKESEKYFALIKVESVGGVEPERRRRAAGFDALALAWPDERLRFEHDPADPHTRLIDLLAPMGKGQRCLIAAPPRAGETQLLASLAAGVAANHPEVHTIVLLIDERPEEVAELRDSLAAEVIASTFDEPPSRHVQIADMAIERARRLVEGGQDVLLLLDSLTRLARAWNQSTPPSGHQLAGLLDVSALHRPKRLFGSARNIVDGGSLTIVATARIETGARIDQLIFDEFAGTANCELTLDARPAARRLFPALAPSQCATQRPERILDEAGVSSRERLRDALTGDPIEDVERLLDATRQWSTNDDLLDKLAPVRK